MKYILKLTLAFAYLHICTFAHFSSVYAQIPPGYYDPAQGLSGQPLKVALHGIIDNHTAVSYNNLYTHFLVTDVKPGNVVWDMYSDVPGGTAPYVYHYNTGDECGSYNSEGDCFNREHSFPASWFDDQTPMYSDMFHLYPTDGYVNNRRSNYPFGEVGNATWTSQNGSKVGSCSWPGYSGTVFEPIDAYKGDFARSYFYMSVRYYGEDGSWPGSPMVNGAELLNWAKSMLLQWHSQDPVSQKEIDRNNLIYGIQHNRNPFIDNPQWAAMIWGPGAGMPEFSAVQPLEVYPNPVSSVCNVLLPAGNPHAELKVFDMSGRELLSFYPEAGSVFQTDLSCLTPGLYILTLSNSENQYRALVLRK